MGVLVDGTKSVTTAGTALQMTTDDVAVQWVRIAAHDDNTGQILVGLESTVVGTGGATARGARIPIPAATLNEGVTLKGPFNISDIWLDAEVSTDGVSFLYLARD